MGPFGFQEIIFLFFIALIIFGPRKLPEIGKTLGKGLREFKKASDDLKANWEEHIREADKPIHDLKQTIHDVKTDVETAASIEEKPQETTQEAAQETGQEALQEAVQEAPEQPTPSTPEETKPNGHTH